MNFTPKMESFCTFFFTPFLELNLLLENNSVSVGSTGVEVTTSRVTHVQPTDHESPVRGYQLQAVVISKGSYSMSKEIRVFRILGV